MCWMGCCAPRSERSEPAAPARLGLGPAEMAATTHARPSIEVWRSHFPAAGSVSLLERVAAEWRPSERVEHDRECQAAAAEPQLEQDESGRGCPCPAAV